MSRLRSGVPRRSRRLTRRRHPRNRAVVFERLEFRRVLTSISDIQFDFDTHVRLAPGSDNWPITWADNGHQYTSWGDGGGFGGTNSKGRVSLGFGRLEGDWNNYTGHNVWGGKDAENPAQFKGKSYGIVSIGGVLYMWNMVEDHYFERSELYYSTDKAATWKSAGWGFQDLQSAFSVPTILNFGQDYAGARDDFVYVYAPGAKELKPEGSFPGANRFNSADTVDLARVPKDRILEETAYQFFAGFNSSGEPQWTNRVDDRVAVLTHPGKVHWTMQVAHLPSIDRYLMFNNGGGKGFDEKGRNGDLEIYQSAEPWGPWEKIKTYPKWGGYKYTFSYFVAPKWTSADGKDFTLVFSGDSKEDSWNSVRARVVVSEGLSLSVDRPDIAENEGNGAATGTVTRNTADLSQPLVVQLTSSDVGELAVPAQVVIPAGDAAASFPVDARDDTLLDGTQRVTITAAATGFDDATRSLNVLDHETLTVQIDRSSIGENAGQLAARVTVTRGNTDIQNGLSVTLESRDTSEVVLPRSLTIPANANSASTFLDAVDDTLLDGTQSVQVVASSSGYVSVGDVIDVTDHELITLTVTPDVFLESAGANAATLTVRRSNTDRSQSLQVDLSNPDATEIALPSQVTIPADAESVDVIVGAVDDDDMDGDQTVRPAGSATGYVTGAVDVRVLDDDSGGDGRLILEIDRSEIAENEGTGATQGTVTRVGLNLNVPLSVFLSSSDTSEATVPDVVTIPANAASFRFPITAIDDRTLDGTQTTLLAAIASGLTGSEVPLKVLDHETISVSPADQAVAENLGAGASTVTITRSNTDDAAEVLVRLFSSDTSEATLPEQVTIPASQSSVTVDLDAIDDTLLDGDQVVSLRAQATDFAEVPGTITVTDYEELRLTVDRSAVREDEGTGATVATVTRGNSDIGANLVVQLVSSDPGEAGMPSSVTIPAGQKSATLDVDAVDDRQLDGTQQVALRGTAGGYVSIAGILDVEDHETLAVTIDADSVSEAAGKNAAEIVIARSNVDDILPDLQVTLTSSDETEALVPSTVTIPAGQAAVTVQLEAVDDQVLDGPHVVTVTASQSPYFSIGDTVTILDHETLTVDIAASEILENAGPAATTVTISRNNTDIGSSLEVTLTSDDVTEARVPDKATIPAGQTSVTVPVDAVDDQESDRSQIVHISAAAPGYANGAQDTLRVLDDEPAPRLSLSVDPTVIAENDGAGAAVATIERVNGTLSDSLTVQLTSLDTTEARVPSSVIIPAGKASATFDIEAVDDQLLDGSQVVRLEASASEYDPAQTNITVSDFETITLVLADSSVREHKGAGATRGTVTRSNTDVGQPLVVTLSSSDTSEATVPAQVTIPANAQSVTFDVDAVDDDLLDGPQTVTLTPAAPNYESVAAELIVLDHEAIILELPTDVIAEDMGPDAVTATVRRTNTDTGAPLTVRLSSTDTSEATVPPTVVIPAGEEQATFTIAAVDDAWPDGPVQLRIQAEADDYRNDKVRLTVTDDETFSLVLNRDQVSENAGNGAVRATVTTSSFSFEPVVVDLSSSDTTEARTPSQVVIPGGDTSASFDIDAIDDSILDGHQVVYFVASTPDNIAAARLVVEDHELLSVEISAEEVSENAGDNAATAVVTRGNTDIELPLVVQLTSSDLTELRVPDQVTIPSGASSVTFFLDAVDDQILDGPQEVTVTPHADGYVTAGDTIIVLDHEGLDLDLTPTTLSEFGGQATLTVSRSNLDDSAAVTVRLSSSDTSEISVPATAVIPAGKSSVDVVVQSVDDTLLDGTQSANITATSDGFQPATTSVKITDFETLQVVIGADSIPENAGPAAVTAVVTRSNTDRSQALTVQLQSDDVTEITVPQSVQIPAGQASVTFALDVVDDTVRDGPQTVTVSASASGYVGLDDQIVVTDYEALDLSLEETEVREDAGPKAFRGTISRSSDDAGQDLEVTLSSSDTTEIILPATVVIPAGQTSASFDVDVRDDRLLDGAQDVTVSAAASGYVTQEASVRVKDHETITVSLADTSVSEHDGAGATTMTVIRSNVDDSGSFSIDLDSSDTTEATVPGEVVFPEGVGAVVVDVEARDDALLDGTQTTFLTAVHAGFSIQGQQLEVTDHETLTIVLADKRVSEADGVGATTATVTRANQDRGQPLTVTLSSSDTSAALVPSNITIPAGEASVVFAVDAVDDDEQDATQVAVISGVANGYVSVPDRLEVEDDESLSLSVSANRVVENDGADAATLTVTRPESATGSDQVIALSSSDPSELTLPASLTIPRGSTSASVKLDAVDDTLLDGDQIVRLVASHATLGSNRIEVTVEDYETLTVVVADASIYEDAGTSATTATVTRSNSDVGSAITVQLSVDDTTEAQVPTSVQIPAGKSSATFAIDAVDDNILDGDQIVQVQGKGNGYIPVVDALTVLDRESLTITFDPVSIGEDQGADAVTGTLDRGNDDLDGAVEVFLASNDVSELTVPASVIIPAGSRRQTFKASAVDDNLLDGVQTVTITGNADGYATAIRSIDVTDHETLTLTIAVDAFREDQGANAASATVTRNNQDLGSPLTVTLSSDDTTEATVPSQVTIASGASSASFFIDAVDDSESDGDQTVTVTASAGGYIGSSDTVVVQDHEPQLTLSLQHTSVLESSGESATTGTVHRTGADTSNPLRVMLASSDLTEIVVPHHVTIPAGATEASFAVHARDDIDLDGTQTVVIEASSTELGSGTVEIDVEDEELWQNPFNRLDVNFDKSVAPIDGLFIFNYLNNPDNPNQPSTPRPQNAPFYDVSGDGIISALDSLLVFNFVNAVGSTTTRLELNIDRNFIFESETQGEPVTVRRRGSDSTQDLLVVLDNDKMSQAEVPVVVTIPAGSATATFTLRPIDDTEEDGDQAVGITAEAGLHAPASLTVWIGDDDGPLGGGGGGGTGPGGEGEAGPLLFPATCRPLHRSLSGESDRGDPLPLDAEAVDAIFGAWRPGER